MHLRLQYQQQQQLVQQQQQFLQQQQQQLCQQHQQQQLLLSQQQQQLPPQVPPVAAAAAGVVLPVRIAVGQYTCGEQPFEVLHSPAQACSVVFYLHCAGNAIDWHPTAAFLQAHPFLQNSLIVAPRHIGGGKKNKWKQHPPPSILEVARLVKATTNLPMIAAGCSRGGFWALMLAQADPSLWAAVVSSAGYCDATGGEWYMRQAADGVAATPCICINGLLDELSRPHGQYLPFWQRMIDIGQSVWWYNLTHEGVSAACFNIQSEFSLYLWAAVQALVFPPCRG